MWIKVWHRVLDAILGLTAISSPQTAHDILHELCEMLGLQSEEDIEEFGLYADPGKRVSTLHSILYITFIMFTMHVRTSHRSICLYEIRGI